jgi:hypothetical protein
MAWMKRNGMTVTGGLLTGGKVGFLYQSVGRRRTKNPVHKVEKMMFHGSGFEYCLPIGVSTTSRHT